MKERYRHELKYIISELEMEILKRRLSMFMDYDAHAGTEGYFIRSLYFDSMERTAFVEKQAGMSKRKKYRIRSYNYSDDFFKLECKKKQDVYIYKTAASLTRAEYDRILAKDYSFLLEREEQVCKDFYLECVRGMEPVVFVDYDRVPFVYPHGDVRVTFDCHVRAAWLDRDPASREMPVYEVVPEGQLIMEVKFTEYLPELIRQIVVPGNSICCSASKYTMCMEKKYELT